MRQLQAMLSRKVFRNFMLSFFAAFVLPLGLLVAVMFRTLGAVETEMRTSGRLGLEQFCSRVDGQLYGVLRAGDNLIVGEKVLYFSTIADPLEYTVNTACFTMLRSLMKDVSTLIFSNDDISDCYLHFGRSGSVVSTSFWTAERYFSRVEKAHFADEAQWRGFLGGGESGFVSFRDAVGETSLAYVRKSRGGDVTLVLHLDRQGLLRRDGLPDALREASLSLYDRNGVLLYADADAPPFHPEAGDFGEADEGGTHTLWSRSANTGVVYVMRVPARAYFSRLNTLRAASVALSVILLLSGLTLAYYMAKKRYRPIDDLRAIVADPNAPAAGRDDFAYLRDMLSGMQSEQISIRQRLRANNKNMEHFVLEQLLGGTYTSLKAVEEQLLSLDVVFDSNLFCVIAARIDSMPPPEGDAGEKDRQIMRFVARNALEEALAAYNPLCLEQSSRLYILLSPGDEALWHAPILPLLSEVREMLGQHYALTLSFSVSERVEGMHMIHIAYAWAREALTGEGEGVLRLGWEAERRAESGTDALLQTVEDMGRRLSHLMIACDEAAARETIDALIEACAGENSGWSVRLALSALLNQIVQPLLPRLSPEQTARIAARVRRYLNAPPSREEARQVGDILLALLSDYAEATEGERTADVAPRANRFIQRHYADSAMNVAMVAGALSLTPGYASALYKKQTGRSLMDAINLERLRHARGLLETTRLGLEEVAEQAGYYNVSTFIRVFKRYEGVTPGQYRALKNGDDV